MHIKITRTTVANKQFVIAGNVYDLPDAEARELIQLGKAEHVIAEAQPSEDIDPLMQTPPQDVEPAKPKRGRRAK